MFGLEKSRVDKRKKIGERRKGLDRRRVDRVNRMKREEKERKKPNLNLRNCNISS